MIGKYLKGKKMCIFICYCWLGCMRMVLQKYWKRLRDKCISELPTKRVKTKINLLAIVFIYLIITSINMEVWWQMQHSNFCWMLTSNKNVNFEIFKLVIVHGRQRNKIRRGQDFSTNAPVVRFHGQCFFFLDGKHKHEIK